MRAFLIEVFDRGLLALGTCGGIVVIANPVIKEIVRKFKAHETLSGALMAFPDGKLVACNEARMKIWNIN